MPLRTKGSLAAIATALSTLAYLLLTPPNIPYTLEPVGIDADGSVICEFHPHTQSSIPPIVLDKKVFNLRLVDDVSIRLHGGFISGPSSARFINPDTPQQIAFLRNASLPTHQPIVAEMPAPYYQPSIPTRFRAFLFGQIRSSDQRTTLPTTFIQPATLISFFENDEFLTSAPFLPTDLPLLDPNNHPISAN